MRRVVPLLCLLSVAGCKDQSSPDARVNAGSVPDARVPDASGAGGGPDAATTVPDAAVRDAPLPDAPTPDAPTPDAAGPAELLINELSPNFVERHDLVELLVTKTGTTAGITLEKDYPHNTVVLATLPDVVVQVGELIVVHLFPTGTTAEEETGALDQHQTVDNYDGAWDFLGADDDIGYQDRVVSLRAADGQTKNAVPFYRTDIFDPDQRPRDFPADLQSIIDDGLWNEICAPAPCGEDSDLASVTVTWTGVGTTANPDAADGASVARKPGARADKVSDWQAIPQAVPFNTYGAANEP